MAVDEFDRVSEKNSHLLRSWCRQCSRKERREWYQRNRARELNKAKAYREKPESKEKRLRRDQDKLRNLDYRIRLSITNTRMHSKENGGSPCTTDFKTIRAAFTGFCDICGISEKNSKHRLRLDHCHESGSFRGWLCFHCNTMLGMARDSLAVLGQAVIYLEKCASKSSQAPSQGQQG